jgi:cyclopropane-fatty-acyl-phospholipid synthase
MTATLMTTQSAHQSVSSATTGEQSTQLTTPPQQPSRWQRWCSQWVLKHLARCNRGQLTLTLPNGQSHTFGEPNTQALAADPDAITATLNVKDWAFFTSLILGGHIGGGESYVAGHWDSPKLAKVLGWFILNANALFIFNETPTHPWWGKVTQKLAGLGHGHGHTSYAEAAQHIRAHYDLGNDFFKLMLDPSMTYSSALFTHPEQPLMDAQLAKYDSLCQSLRLQAGQHLLEIGSGWGGMACYAAKKYGVKVTTVTLSPSQHAYATAWVKQLGLADRVEIKLLDFRKLTGQYDAIVSIEMIEALGDKHYEAFFAQCHKLLKPTGLLGIQAITCPDNRYPLLKNNVDFIQKHIFPGSLIPSVGRLNQASAKVSDLSLLELKDMASSYALTLQRWDDAIAEERDTLLALQVDEGTPYTKTFLRQWHYYLMYCKAAFVLRHLSVAQFLYGRPNCPALSGTTPWEQRL